MFTEKITDEFAGRDLSVPTLFAGTRLTTPWTQITRQKVNDGTQV